MWYDPVIDTIYEYDEDCYKQWMLVAFSVEASIENMFSAISSLVLDDDTVIHINIVDDMIMMEEHGYHYHGIHYFRNYDENISMHKFVENLLHDIQKAAENGNVDDSHPFKKWLYD